MEKQVNGVIEYELYGQKLKTTPIGKDELLVTEGLQYITPINGGEVYVLSSILPESEFLIGHEFHDGEEEMLRISEHRFCERPY